MRIDLGGHSFNHVADADGIYWYVTEFEGWGSPPVEQSYLSPAHRDGVTVTVSKYGARAMTLTGVVKAPSEAMFWKAWNTLVGGLAVPSATGTMTVYESTAKDITVRLGAEPRKTMQYGSWFEFEIPLIAPDPLKYAQSTTSVSVAAGATQSVTNDGNTMTWPVMSGTGAGGRVIIANNLTAQTFKTKSGVPITGAFVADAKARTVTVAGANSYDDVDPNSVWFPIMPGAQNIQNTGTVGLTVEFKAAWA